MEEPEFEAGDQVMLAGILLCTYAYKTWAGHYLRVSDGALLHWTKKDGSMARYVPEPTIG